MDLLGVVSAGLRVVTLGWMWLVVVVVVTLNGVGVGGNRAQLLTRGSVDDRLSLDDML